MAAATSAMASSRVMSSWKPASNTDIALRLPDPMVAKGRESVEPWGKICGGGVRGVCVGGGRGRTEGESNIIEPATVLLCRDADRRQERRSDERKVRRCKVKATAEATHGEEVGAVEVDAPQHKSCADVTLVPVGMGSGWRDGFSCCCCCCGWSVP